MLIAFSLVLLTIWIWILISIYSIFIPFFHNLWDVYLYNTAYYWSIAWLERWLLVSKYQKPWFQGKWWRTWQNFWPASDYKNLDLWVLKDSFLYRNINSRTTRIPQRWKWNIDYMFRWVNSENFNKLWYFSLQKILLYIDNTIDPEKFYKNDWNVVFYNWNMITWTIRLPDKVFWAFGWDNWALLCDDNDFWCDLDGDGLKNEKMVLRQLNWNFSWEKFSILPFTKVFYNQTNPSVDILHDSNIRESDLNTIKTWNVNLLEFSNTISNYNPVQTRDPYLITKNNVISNVATWIENLKFPQIFSQWTWINLQLSLVSLLLDKNANIYPFLEYSLWFDSQVSDINYHIKWTCQIWNYKVETITEKPTSENSSYWDFTIIF